MNKQEFTALTDAEFKEQIFEILIKHKEQIKEMEQRLENMEIDFNSLQDDFITYKQGIELKQ